MNNSVAPKTIDVKAKKKMKNNKINIFAQARDKEGKFKTLGNLKQI